MTGIKFKFGFRITILLLILIPITEPQQNKCGILYCADCNPNTNFCNRCERPYKPGYANQSVCTRCAINCAVCQKVGNDSSGACLSCEQNYNFSFDDRCSIFEIWVYVVVIACYVIFVVILFFVFCFMKKRKQKSRSQWFQKLKSQFNKVDSHKITVPEFEKMCQYLIQLLKESSSYNNLKFKDRQYEKAIKIKDVKLKIVQSETHIKKIKMYGFDNSEWVATGYILTPKEHNNKLKLWFAKNYKRKVFSESISKIIIYQSEFIQSNQIKGKWYYYDSPDVGGQWAGTRDHSYELQNRQLYFKS